MQQEATKKNKKWLWLVLLLLLLLAVVGVVLALVLPGSGNGGSDTDAIESDLYWNVDGEYYQSISEIAGLSGRTAAEDGNYYITFAVGGQQKEYQIADKQLVNYIDSMQVMGLVFDDAGVVINAVEPDVVATQIAEGFYVERIGDGTITVNSSKALNGMSVELEITASAGIYDVTDGAEMVGQVGELEIMDQVLIYGSSETEVTHVFITEHPVDAEIYWRVERCYDTENKVTTRVPDENGVYTIQFAHNGELVDLKCRDVEVVNGIDSYSVLVGQFALLFDEEGYIVDLADVAMALRGVYLAQDFHITAIDGDTYTATRISAGTQQGKVVTFTLADDCQIWQCCQYGCYDHNCGEFTDYLQLQDRVNIYTNIDGEAIMIFIGRRTVEGGMYYNFYRYYDTVKGSTREKVNGYYVFEMLHDGEFVTVKTKDKDIADQIDSLYNRCVGLELDGNIITRVYDATCVYGGANMGAGTPVTSLMGSVAVITSTSSGTAYNCVLSADCQVYNAVTGEYGVKPGGTLTLQQGDLVTCYRNIYDEICIIFVTARPVTGAKIYYNLERKWNADTLETKREPDAEGYYVFTMACEGKQVTVKTKDRGMASFIDEQLAPMAGLKVNKDGIITNAYSVESVVENGGKACNYRTVENVTKNSFNTFYISGTTGERINDATTWTIAKGCKIYNCSTVYEDFRGEVSTLQNGDRIQAIKDFTTGEITQIFIMNRDAAYGVQSYDAYCAHCGKTVTWAPYSGGTFTADGHYFVHKDLTVSQGNIGAKDDPNFYDVVIDLKGHTVKTAGRAFYVYDKLTVMDSVGGGKVVTLTKNIDTMYSGAGVFMISGAEFNLVGGELTVSENNTVFSGYGGVIYMGEGCTVNMSGGSITGGTTTVRGGNVYVTPGSKFNMTGGTISGGTSPAGGNVFVASKATMTMSGGTIDGGLYVWDSEALTLSGKVVISGDGVTVPAGAKLKVSGLTSGASVVVNGDGVFTEDLTNAAGYLSYFKPASNADSIEVDGNALKYNKAPVDYNGVDNSNLVFEAGTTNAYCAVCDKTVTWTALTADAKTSLVGGKHYYLDKDLTYQGTATDTGDCLVVAPGGGSTACLHLNGHNITAVNSRVIYGSGGVLNVFGNGTVTGGYTHTMSYILAGTVGINTNVGSGCINLIGGTYTCTTGLPTVAISGNGGKINMYTGATVKGNGSNQAVYVGNAGAVNAVFGIYGGKIEGGQVYMTGASTTAGNAAILNLAGGKITGGIMVNTNSIVNVSGAPVVSGEALKLVSAKLTLGEMTANANILVSASGIFTEALDNAESYKSYFSAEEGSQITVFDNALCVSKLTSDELVLDPHGYGWCDACQAPVQWTELTDRIGHKNDSTAVDTHYHYYLSDDLDYTADLQFAERYYNTTCLHLNGYDMSFITRIRIGIDATLNVMGSGSITSSCTGSKYNDCVIQIDPGATVNLYGGSYNCTNSEVPTIKVAGATAQLNIYDGVVINDGLLASSGSVTLNGSASTGAEAKDAITIGSNGKLIVDENWTGTAVASFVSEMKNNAVPSANGASTGAFEGSLTMTDGTALYGQDNLLVTADYVPGSGDEGGGDEGGEEEDTNPYDDPLVLDADGYAVCPACGGDPVQWTALATAGRIGNAVTGHYYLTGDTTSGTYTQFVTAATDGTVCVHLNGYTLTNSGRSFSVYYDNSTINVMGSGTVISTGNNSNTTYNDAMLYVQGENSVLNIYSGTYIAQGATQKGILVNKATGVVNVYDGVSITGGAQVAAGTLSVDGASSIDSISVAEGGKLIVNENWTGVAEVTFASAITDGVIPAANGASTGDFTGTLTTTVDGTTYNVIAKDGGLVLSTAAGGEEEEDELQLDENGYAVCPVCGGDPVKWTAVTGNLGSACTDGGHYYLTEDLTTTGQFITVTGGKTVCVHLNGKDLTYGSRMFVTGATLNIMGSGTVTSTETTADNMAALVAAYGNGYINLYGGTYKTTNPNGMPVAKTVGSIYAGITLYGDASVESVLVEKGTLTLNDNCHIDALTLNADGKLVIAGDWTGEAVGTFASITDGVIDGGISVGEYTGTLTTTVDGVTYNVISRNGVLVLDTGDDEEEESVSYDGVLALDGNSQALCPVCNEKVTWTDINGMSLKRISTNTGHFYYSADCATGTNVQNFVNVPADGKVCIHLNGKTVSYGSRIGGLNANATVNIMGSGTMTLNPFNGDQSINAAGMVLSGDGVTLNLYAGNYVSADATRPYILVNNATAAVNIYDGVTLSGGILVSSGTASLNGSAALGTNAEDIILVDTNGKLTVSEDWTGTAVASFNALTELKEIPEANGVSGGAFTGTLTLDTADGMAITGSEGKLVVALDAITAEIVRAKAVSMAANAMTFPENGGTYEAYCPACDETVTWKGRPASSMLFWDSLTTLEGNDHLYFYGSAGNITSMNMLTFAGLTADSLVDHNTLCVHLNGCDVNYAGRLFINKAVTVNIMGEGSMNSTGRTEDYGNISMIGGSTLNLYGGTYTYNGANSVSGTPYSTIFSNQAANVINIYDGVTVQGTNTAAIGMTRGTLNMYGGTVENGTGYNNGTNDLGGNIYAAGSGASTKVNLNLYGGTVQNGTAYSGGNIYTNYANVIIANTVTGGKTSYMGGNIFVQNSTTEITETGMVSGGTITDSATVATTYGGNITVSGSGTLDVYGTVTGGSAGRGGNIDMTANSTVNINDGAVITGGSTLSGHGGNIYFQNAGAVLNLNGGTVSGGSVASGKLGGNVYASGGMMTLSGDVTVTGGTVGEDVSNIYLTSTGKLRVLNDWTGEAGVKFAAVYTVGSQIATTTAQCGAVENGTFTAGGSYDGTLIYDGTEQKIVGTDGALWLEPGHEDDGVLKILGIGNSYTIDSMHLLYEIYKAENPDQKVSLGFLYYPGCSLSQHVDHLTNDKAVYVYYEISDDTNGAWKTHGKSVYNNGTYTYTDCWTVEMGIEAQQWDIVTLQQSSANSGKPSTYNSDIQTIQNYVIGKLGYTPEFMWNMTWAYAEGYSNSYYVDNNGTFSQAVMYEAITDAVQEKIVTDSTFSKVIPTGTAIQNARTYWDALLTSDAADTTTYAISRPDNTHLTLLGRYIAAYTWYCAISGETLDTLALTEVPASLRINWGVYSYTETDLAVIAEAVKNAISTPYAVTETSY